MSYQISYQPSKVQGYSHQATDGHIFKTEQDAANYCQAMNAYFAAMEPISTLPYELNRADYEAACAANGVGTMSDAECGGYGVRYGEFAPPTYTPAQCVKMDLARRRLNGIEAERKAQPRPTPKSVQMVRCDCGHSVPRSQVMSASLGSSCPDCYDRMSD